MDGLPDVSLNGLRVFEVAGRLLGFTAAARELGSSQSAVSQTMRQLEEQLGFALFDRVHRGVRLTAAGKTLLESVQSGFADMQETIAVLQAHDRPPRLGILTDFSLAAYWLLPRLPDFRQRHPGIDVNIVTGQDVLDWRQRNVDVAIVFCSAQELQQVPRLSREEVVPVCSPAFLRSSGPIRDFAALSRQPLLSLLAGSGQHWLDWPVYFEQQAGIHYPPSSTWTFNNYTLLMQAVIAGQGIGLGWRGLIDGMVEAGIVVPLSELALATDNGYGVIDASPDARSSAKSDLLRWLGSQSMA